MDARGSREISWLPKTAQGEAVTQEDIDQALEDPQGGQTELGPDEAMRWGREIGKLTLINEILNNEQFRDLVRRFPDARGEFEGLADNIRGEVDPDIYNIIDQHGDPVVVREHTLQDLFTQLSQTYSDDDIMSMSQQTTQTVNNPNEFQAIMQRFQNLYGQLTQSLIPQQTRFPGQQQGYFVTPASNAKAIKTGQETPASPSPLTLDKYQSQEHLEDDLAKMGPFPETYDKILERVDDEDQDSAKSALTAFFQGLPEGLCTLYSIMVKAGIAEPVDSGIVEKVMDFHPELQDNGEQENKTALEGLILPPPDSGLYTTSKSNLKETKTAGGYLGGTSTHYYTHGPEDNRHCPKLRNVVSTFVCRYHCLDGLPVDDHQILCGEAIWRQAVMDKYSREYRDADGNWVGGYINKRFEVERATHEHPYQLKPNQRSAPINEDAWSQEKRLQELRRNEGEKRGYSPTPGDPEGLYNWDTYEHHGGPKNPQLFEKKKDSLAKNASKKERTVSADAKNPFAETTFPESSDISETMTEGKVENIWGYIDQASKQIMGVVDRLDQERTSEAVGRAQTYLPLLFQKIKGYIRASFQNRAYLLNAQNIYENIRKNLSRVVEDDSFQASVKKDRWTQALREGMQLLDQGMNETSLSHKPKVTTQEPQPEQPAWPTEWQTASGEDEVVEAESMLEGMQVLAKDMIRSKQCPQCQQYFPKNAGTHCPNCKVALLSRDDVHHQNVTKSVPLPKDSAERAPMMANGVYRVTRDGVNYYGDTLREAAEKAVMPKSLTELQESGPTTKDLSEDISYEIQESPSWKPKEAPAPVARQELSPQEVSEMVRPDHDPTPSTPGRPPIELIQGGETKFPEEEGAVDVPSSPEGNALDQYLAQDAMNTSPEEQEEVEDSAADLALGPDPRT